MHSSNAFTRTAAIACLLGATLLLAACPPRRSIESINRDPARYGDNEVTIAGRVVNSFDVMGVGAFEIDDGTGRLWVYSNKFGVPGQGTSVAVTGMPSSRASALEDEILPQSYAKLATIAGRKSQHLVIIDAEFDAVVPAFGSYGAIV